MQFITAWQLGVSLSMTSAARCARRSQAHATEKQTENDRKTKPKARRRGAVPAEPLGDRLPLFPPRMAFFHWFLPFIAPLEFAFSVRLW